VSTAAWFGLVALGFVVGQQAGSLTAWFWWMWAVIILLFGRGRVAHPNVLDRHRPLPPSRQLLGWATIVLFVVTFSPVPIYYT
jgi:hypothetical protein